MFLGAFGGKMGVATRPRMLPMVNLIAKKLAPWEWVDFLGQPLSRNHIFEIFRGGGAPLIFCQFLEAKIA